MRPMLARTAAALIVGGSLLVCSRAIADDADQSPPPSTDGSPTIDLSSLPTDLDGQIARAQVLRANGKYQDAAHALGQMMLVAPDDPRVVGEYGKDLVLENRPQDAAAFLKRAIQLQNGDWTIYSALGIAFDEQGDFKDAKLAYQRALVLKPGEPAILNNYAMSRHSAGDLVSARQIIAEAAAASADNPTIARNVALLMPTHRTASVPAARVEVAAKPAAVVTVAQEPAVTPAPVSTASAANPRTANAQIVVAAGAASATVAATAPPQVLMQAVPADPLAGPVARTKHARHRVAARPAAHGAKPAIASTKAKLPTLRMSADAS